MRRPALVLALLAALLAPSAAAAHPLGNFTVNQFTRIEPSGDRVYLLHVLDLAEIPTFQARDEVRALGRDGYAAALANRLARGLSLTADGRPLALHELRHALAFPDGAGGLKTTRLEVVLESDPLAPGRPVALAFANRNDLDRIGWREVVLVPTHGATAADASVPAESVSDALRAYPKDLLRSPLDVRGASARVTPGLRAGPPPALGGASLAAPDRVVSASDHGFASLIGREDLGIGVVLVSLLVAMFWGAAHALSPGHGKAIVAAYLVGTRGTARQAVSLGLIVTVTHTIGVFALGLVTLALSQFVVPDRLYPWLNLAAALLVVAVGVSVFRVRLRDWLRARRGAPAGGAHHHHDHRHDHQHEHHHHHDHHHHEHPEHDGGSHGHGHRHAPEPGRGWRGLFGVGISGGLLPCPSALVVLLAAISLHRVGYGLVLILAFSVGLAATITGIGLLAVGAKRVFGRLSGEGRLVRLLPALSALAILAFGIAMTVRAVPSLT
jgi:ABC-type nickel/cobalt efflux system permease component RcnA